MEPPQSTKILVVDDNAQNRALALATLEQEDYLVFAAASGREGLALFEAEQPACVLLDVRMPDLDGFEVCRRLRQLPGGAEVPVLFLTALRDVDSFDKARAAGGDEFLTKPVRPAELLARVRTMVALRDQGAELRTLTATISQQRDDLLRTQLLKDALATFVVHDLKNPVNAIGLHAQLLLRDKSLSAAARQSVVQIRADIEHLVRMIMNLLDITKGEEGRLTPTIERVELAGLVEEVLRRLTVRAEVGAVTLVGEVPALAVRADEDMFRRVLENLLENAIRHTPHGGRVTVAAAGAGDEVEVRVSDTGTGVPPELLESIFDKYVQVASGDHALTRGGRGLGLAFCKLAVEAMSGRIFVESSSQGAVFVVRVPRDH